jgi:peptide/nickel transport system substrate-binding protein
MLSKKWAWFALIVFVGSMILTACGGEETIVEVTRVVTEEKTVVETVVEKVVETVVEKETIIEEKVQTVVETVVETVIETVMVEPEEAPPPEIVAPDPETLTFVEFGDPDTLDPNLNYETAGGELILNVAEGLIFYNFNDSTTFVPQLALEVPTVENGGISEDGLTYTFNIRQGVKFHNGADLTPSDFAYTYQRGLLQSSPDGPQWLLIEPIMGYSSGDITEAIDDGAYAGDPEALKANAAPEDLVAVCEEVKSRIVADDENWTLTITLAQPWGPFLATIAQGWGYAIDQDWAIENGGWDGSCDTWVDMEYAMTSENDPLTDKINGTGPYMLDHWTPGEEWVLVANENYWRGEDEPVWPDGPSGVPRIKRIVYKNIPEWGTRFAILQAGDAEWVAVPIANRPQVDAFVGEFCDWQTFECEPNPDNPDGMLRKWGGLPSVSRTNVFLNFDLSQEEGVNPYSGSGQLDGNGIPPDFFADIHVRRAMNYCFDYETFIADAQNGEGVRNNGPIIKDMLGYNEDGPMYEFDLDMCEAELAEAHGGQLPDVGFRFQMAFNTGNVTRQTACNILQSSLRSINSGYQIECLGLPWPTMLRSFRAGQLPAVASGWIEDIHDPHNWAQPFTVGTYAGRQNLDPELRAQFQELVTAGVMASDPAEREQIYFDLQQLYHDQAIQVTLSQATGVHYEQRWVKDWFYRVGQFGSYFYAYGLEGGE